MINIREHTSSSYAPRTWHNAAQGVTLAIAVDFSTAGEKLTTKAAQKNGIVHLDARNFATGWLPAARELYKALKEADCRVINVAGNGIYTYNKHGYEQSDVNAMVYQVLKQIHEHWKLEHVVSGGQSGADLAGLIAAAKLDIPCTGMWPKGYKMRFADGVDVNHTPEQIMEIINAYAD
jgi:hypothetical protein